MAAYRWVYDTHQLQADCQEPGSAPKPHGRQSSMDYLYLLPVSFSLAQLDLFSTQQFRRSSGVKLQGVNSQGVAASPRVCVCAGSPSTRSRMVRMQCCCCCRWCKKHVVRRRRRRRRAHDAINNSPQTHTAHAATSPTHTHTHTHTSTRAGR